MENDGRGVITEILRAAEAEGIDPGPRLWPLIYDDLRRMAHRQLRRERPGQTLATTALVHEAYLKLADGARLAGRGRAYFFGAAARAMRQILVDHARRRNRFDRMSDDERAGVHPTLAVDGLAADVLDLHETLERFAGVNERAARVVEYRFFGGLNVDETAEVVGVSPRTVKNDWAVARAWMFRELGRASED